VTALPGEGRHDTVPPGQGSGWSSIELGRAYTIHRRTSDKADI
jgi:hypothetical protein